jgi:hypothetical protein
MQNGYIPTAADFAASRVTNSGQSEIIRQRLFDWQLYPAPGAVQLQFFQNPIGQGITSALGAAVGSAKTPQDTNMRLPGQLPSGASYLMESIEVIFYPGSSAAANTFSPRTVSKFAAANAATVANDLDDVNFFYLSGMLELFILSKNYLTESPLQCFAPKTYVGADVALATTSATAGEVATTLGRSMGRPYYIEPMISIQPAVNFSVNLTWPGLVPNPSGFNGRVGVIFDGYMMRASQ